MAANQPCFQETNVVLAVGTDENPMSMALEPAVFQHRFGASQGDRRARARYLLAYGRRQSAAGMRAKGGTGAYFRGRSGNNLLHQDQLEAAREGVDDEGLAFDLWTRNYEDSSGDSCYATPQARA